MNQGLQALRAMPVLELIFLVGIPLYWFASFPIFVVRSAIWGTPRTERIARIKSKVIPRFLLEYGYWMLQAQVKVFLRLGISANMMTTLSLLTAMGGAVYLGAGRFGLGGWLMFFSFFCDAYDGIIARATNTSSARGEFYDSVVDRYADAMILLGFLYYYRNDPFAASLFALALIGTTVMGYAKAKGEAVGIDPSVGLMQRNERAAYLGVATVISSVLTLFVEPGAAHPMHHLVLVAMVPIAFFTNVTAIWRTAYVMRRMPRVGAPPPSPAALVAVVEEDRDAREDREPGFEAAPEAPALVRS